MSQFNTVCYKHNFHGICYRHLKNVVNAFLIHRSIVRLGEYDFSTTFNDAVRDIRVIRSDRHSNYSEKYGTNDIAILHLERDVDISRESLAK